MILYPRLMAASGLALTKLDLFLEVLTESSCITSYNYGLMPQIMVMFVFLKISTYVRILVTL